MNKNLWFGKARKKITGLSHQKENGGNRKGKTAISQKQIAIFSAFALLMALAATTGSNNLSIPSAYAANTLTVNGYAVDGRPLGMWIVIQQNGATVKTGFTPLTFAGIMGTTYSVQAHDYTGGAIYFDHWEDGSTTRTRSVVLNSDVSVTAYYKAPPPPNRSPVAVNDTGVTDQDKPLTIDVLSNDSDPDGNSLTIASTTTPMHGSVIMNADNTLTYKPVTKFSGQDAFSYLVSDGKGATATGTVTVQVNFVNSAPIAVDQSVSTNEDASLPINLAASDKEGNSLTFAVISNPLHGTLASVSGNATTTYTPEPNFNGQDSFQFVANDGFVNSSPATLTILINAQNDAPAAVPGSATTSEDMARTILLNATDVDGDPLSYSIVQNPLHGTLAAITTNNSFTYTPAANYNGADNFAFKSNDGKADSNTASISITIVPVNDNPAANNDLATTNQDIPVTVNVLNNDDDVDGDTLKVLSTTAPLHGSASVSSDGLAVNYKPASGFSGSDSFSYAVTDGNGGTSTAAVSITVKSVASTYALTVNSADMYGKATGGLYAVITKSGATVKTGFTSLSFVGSAGATYSVTVSDYGSTVFDHWDNGSIVKARTLALNSNTTVTAVFRVPTVSLSPTSGVGGMTSIQVSGTYFTPNSAVTVTYDGGSVATASTNSAGAFSASFKAPSLGTGFHTVQATDGKAWKASAKFQDTTPPPPSPLRSLIPKNGIYVALYMYPSAGDGATEWQKVIDAKTAHPSVPIVAAFNPNSGPGSAKDANFATWVAKERSAGVIMLGYTYDNYGTRPLTDLKTDADKYKNWYNADGLFIDEFTNKAGNEQHYKDVTAYVKSIGMKMTMGNPGTDVPKSFVGTVDVLNITEGKGYIPISWLQYCINCTADQGWHNQFDSLYFSYMRYDITSLDTAFEVESSKWVGLLYITDGNDSDGRWFHLPPYFNAEVAALDK